MFLALISIKKMDQAGTFFLYFRLIFIYYCQLNAFFKNYYPLHAGISTSWSFSVKQKFVMLYNDTYFRVN